jgi:hypothetical protein
MWKLVYTKQSQKDAMKNQSVIVQVHIHAELMSSIALFMR